MDQNDFQRYYLVVITFNKMKKKNEKKFFSEIFIKTILSLISILN